MRHKHGIHCRTDFEIHRVRRTLKQVVHNLEEALLLSQRRDGFANERPAPAHRHR
jgi:hypothetical protein